MKYDFDRLIDRTGTNSVKWDYYDMREKVEDMIPMSIADMDFKAPSFITDVLTERVRHGIFGYTVIPESYYASLIGWLERRFSWPVKKEWVRFSPGVVPAINCAVQAYTEPNDKIIIQPPVYHPFRYAVMNNGRTVLNNPLKYEGGKYRMDLEELKDSIDGRTKMIILSSPHNPVGRVWEKDELIALAELCLERGIIIISDEIHADLIMPGHRHIPTASLSPEVAAITVTCTSPSKTFNIAELHAANMIIPDYDLYSRFDAVLAKAALNKPNIMGMAACEAAYKSGDGWVDELVPYLYSNYIYMRDFFSENLPEARVASMEGTYLGWLDFRAFGLSDDELEKILLTSARVAMTPGRIFGAGGEGFFRMNLACQKTILEEALKRIHSALRLYSGPGKS